MGLQERELEWSELSLASDIVVPLTALRQDALALLGGKGANLAELIGAGLSVPPGFCITTAINRSKAHGRGESMVAITQ